MSRFVLHREPVSLMLPGTSISEGMHRGKELPDDSPFVTDPQFEWLFKDDDEARDAPIETGTAAPGEVRKTSHRPGGAGGRR